MRAMTDEEQAVAKELFTPDEVDPREGRTLLTVRFNPLTLKVYYGPHERKSKIVHRGVTLLRFGRVIARTTPTGGAVHRWELVVRYDDRVWKGYLPHPKQKTDVVILKPVK